MSNLAEELIEEEVEQEEYQEIVKALGDRLPEPSGWKILIAIPKVHKKTEGGIYKPEQVLQYEETGSIVGLVLRMGNLAYRDSKRFPEGAWCKPGDYILMRSYSGTRMQSGSQEFRLINDDTVEAVISDPRGVVKVV